MSSAKNRRVTKAAIDRLAERPRLVFTIPGRPIPLERARVERMKLANGKRITRTRTPDKSVAYRMGVQIRMNTAWASARKTWPFRTTEPIQLAVWIYWADGKHGDGSNLFKAIEDAGNGLLWHDDKQIVEGAFYSTIDRVYPRVEVIATILDSACSECETWKFLGKRCPAHDDGRGLEVVG